MRLLDNHHIKPHEVMRPYAKEVLQTLSGKGESLVLIIDQIPINKTFEKLMVAVRFGNRAMSLAWTLKETQGSIGFGDQKPFLEEVLRGVPEGAQVTLRGERAYGTVDLISWCQLPQWDYRLRLKGSILTYQEIQPIPAASLESRMYTNVPITSQGIHTHLGIIHEEGHPDAWIIAMSKPGNAYKTLDYGLRGG